MRTFIELITFKTILAENTFKAIDKFRGKYKLAGLNVENVKVIDTKSGGLKTVEITKENLNKFRNIYHK